jgi:hypothetical protein
VVINQGEEQDEKVAWSNVLMGYPLKKPTHFKAGRFFGIINL